MNTTITKVQDLKPGDRISSVDMPNGPWLTVLAVRPDALHGTRLTIEGAAGCEVADGESHPYRLLAIGDCLVQA